MKLSKNQLALLEVPELFELVLDECMDQESALEEAFDNHLHKEFGKVDIAGLEYKVAEILRDLNSSHYDELFKQYVQRMIDAELIQRVERAGKATYYFIPEDVIDVLEDKAVAKQFEATYLSVYGFETADRI